MKKILNIILPQAGRGKLLAYVCLAMLSGLCSFLFINTVTRVIGLIISGQAATIQKEYVIIFAAIITVFIWVRRTLSLSIIDLSQKLFWHLRMQIISLVLQSNYQQLSDKKSKIHAAVVNDVNVLTNASMSIIDFFAGVLLMLSCFTYLLTLSWQLFLITLVIALSGAVIYHFGSRTNLKFFNRARNLENSFQHNFNAILDGFKEIYMEPAKGRFIYEVNVGNIAREAYRNNRIAFSGFLNNQIIGQVLFYMLISSVLLFFSLVLGVNTGDTVSFVFTLLYLLGSIETVMVLLPGMMRAGIAANHLMDLKKELEEARFSNAAPEKYISRHEFESITVKNMRFSYNVRQRSFGIGPIDFDIHKGEAVFIYGGNGSGKTTFMNAVLGLLPPHAGEIKLNGTVVSDEVYPEYRTLFSIVFSDFYLFDQVMGVKEIDREKWKYYVQLFELEGKVELNGNTLSTTDLSTGQRKRLALITALLEEKPVLVIDEWAADQDPYFRKKFYTRILPLLKEEGITIIAITHDDKYYDCADRLYKMDDGKLIEEQVALGQSANIIIPS